MANYTLPTTTRISRVNRTLGSSTFLQASPFSGGVQSQDWGGSWWEYDLDFDVTQDTEGKALSAFLTRLRGPANTFTFRDPSINNRVNPRSVRVDGSGQTGNTLNTDGWFGLGTFMEAGDFFSLGSGADARLYQVMEPVVASSTKNLLEYSNDFAQGWSAIAQGSGSTPSITPNVATDPDGGSNATVINFDLNGGTTTSDISAVGQFSAPNTVLSVWVRSQTGDPFTLYVRNGNNPNQVLSISSGGWSRYSFINTSATDTTLFFGLRGGFSTSDSTTGMMFYKAQLEFGSVATDPEDTTNIYDKAVTFEPSLRSSPANNAVLEITDPIVGLRPLQPIPNAVTTPTNYRFTMQARENI